jgi:dTDP-4-dehydrorhamnose reductase
MKILLTGSHGMLGSALKAAAHERAWDCQGMERPDVLTATVTMLAARLSGNDLLIHAAANTNVEQCELDPHKCYADNYLLTDLLAQAAAAAGVKMVFISSTGVYGQLKSGPYREYDAASPTTHHHRSKLLAEEVVLRASPLNLVARTGWLFGGPRANPKNFVARRIEEAQAALARGEAIQSNSEQQGVPCFAGDVAGRILDLANASVCGLFNCVNLGAASRFEYVSAIVALSGGAVEVKATAAGSFGRKANVSNNETAENWKMDSLGWAPMPAWQESLARYISEELSNNGETHGH